jgi:uncharacterized protein (TIGR02058 family)
MTNTARTLLKLVSGDRMDFCQKIVLTTKIALTIAVVLPHTVSPCGIDIVLNCCSTCLTLTYRRACRNAIEFNSIPSINSLVPGGYDNMLLRVQLAVPAAAEDIDLDAVAQVFPYGKILPIEVSDVPHLILI